MLRAVPTTGVAVRRATTVVAIGSNPSCGVTPSFTLTHCDVSLSFFSLPPEHHHHQQRWYVSRAHAQQVPQFSILDAVDIVWEGIEERKVKRQAKWDRNLPKLLAKASNDGEASDGAGTSSTTFDSVYRNQDETIELAVNLNLDPRKPGQALRGTMVLPHGTGKTSRVAVFTTDSDLAKKALEQGAAVAGGDDLIDRIRSGAVVPAATFDRAVASTEIVSSLNAIARVLGPRGLMPSPKMGTVQPADERLLVKLQEQTAGSLTYRTDRQGTIHAGIGKASFEKQQILDNVREFMNIMLDLKPETYGRAKKKNKKGRKKGGGGGGANAKYFLSAFLTSTQGKGIKVDLRTVDPSSSFFLDRAP